MFVKQEERIKHNVSTNRGITLGSINRVAARNVVYLNDGLHFETGPKGMKRIIMHLINIMNENIIQCFKFHVSN